MSLAAPAVKKGMDQSIKRMTREERLIRCRQQLFDWTQMYHRGRHAHWIKRNPISPFNVYRKMWTIFGEDRSATWGKAWRRAFVECYEDMQWVRAGGGKIMREGVPQFNLADFSVVDTLDDWFMVTDKKGQIEDRSEAQAWIEDGRMIFTGFLQHSNPELGHHQRSPDARAVGYCNIHTKQFNPVLDLQNFFSIGIKFRSDGRVYMFTVETYVGPENPIHFQGFIRLPPTPEGEWDYIEIPLHHMIPTFFGEFCMYQVGMDPRFCYSFAMQPVGKSGEFRCEVGWIRALRYDARYVMEEEDVEFMQMLDTLGLPLFEVQNLYRGGLNAINIANLDYDSDGEPNVGMGPKPLIDYDDLDKASGVRKRNRKKAIREPRNLNEIQNTLAEMFERRGTHNNLQSGTALRPYND